MSGMEVTCDTCGTIFKSEWSQAEADAEYRANFGSGGLRCVVCAPCYEAFWGWAVKNAPELKRSR